ncbi:hypothetical protein ACFW6V_30195 [Streptomyces sp. NPDC058734]|uniref:hypothetical protein n=1 Tax=Streptomyces sp. NPDC058734 TaxID=3346615 RepID=UPI00367DB399
MTNSRFCRSRFTQTVLERLQAAVLTEVGVRELPGGDPGLRHDVDEAGLAVEDLRVHHVLRGDGADVVVDRTVRLPQRLGKAADPGLVLGGRLRGLLLVGGQHRQADAGRREGDTPRPTERAHQPAGRAAEADSDRPGQPGRRTLGSTERGAHLSEDRDAGLEYGHS